MVEVPALNVKFIDVANATGDWTNESALPFNTIDLILLLFEDIKLAVILYPLAEVLNVPCVTVKLEPPIFSALPRVHVDPTPRTVQFDASTTPLVVNV